MRASISLYASGQIEAGIAAAEQALLKKQICRVGEKHFDTASARGTLAVGLMKAGTRCRCDPRIPDGDPDPDGVGARERRRRRHHGGRGAQPPAEHRRGLYQRCSTDRNSAGDVAVETFASPTPFAAVRCSRRWRRRARAHARQGSGAGRAGAQGAGPGEAGQRAARHAEQCAVARRRDERDEKGVQAINASINALRAERDKLRARRSPSDFRPMPIWSIPSRLRSSRSRRPCKTGEALLSFYFGRDGSFVWAVPKDGPVAFAAITATAATSKARFASCARRWSRRPR